MIPLVSPSLSHAAEVVGHRHRGGDAAPEAEPATTAASSEPVQPAWEAADGGGLLHGEALHGERNRPSLSGLQTVLNMAVGSAVALTSLPWSSLHHESEIEIVLQYKTRNKYGCFVVYDLSQFCLLVPVKGQRQRARDRGAARREDLSRIEN